MTPEQIALIQSRWHSFYSADWDYAQTTVYFFCAAIFVFALGNLVFQFKSNTRIGRVSNKFTIYNKLVAISRSLSARQVYVPVVSYYSPPLGAVVTVAALITFFTVLTFAVHPYVWPNPAMGHSPPIATRSGWIATAILPFLLMFATKVNFIGMVTGVSHEKLQVYHRWTAWIMYIVTLIHMFPFIVRNIQRGEMVEEWTTTSWYWTGVAAVVPQTWLVFMSWGPIRNRYYETFKKLHFIASGIFVPALFIHLNFRLTSWDYIWATAALYGVAWFIRFFRTFYNGIRLSTTLEALPENMVKLTIPAKLRWRPGQHYFVRFLDLGVHAATSHPFTVATLPEKDGRGSVIEVYARVRGGITARLDAVAKAGSLKTSRVLLDGPYGGFGGDFKVYDRVLLLAGGSGATFVVPALLDIVRAWNAGNADMVVCREIHLVWAVRTDGALSWFDQVLRKAVDAAPEGLSIAVSYHVTDRVPAVSGSETDKDSESVEDGKSATTEKSVAKYAGRPDLSAIIAGFCAEGGTVAIATCGPESFNYDVGLAVSSCQMAIVAGKSACSEVYLHQESYSW